MQNVLIIDSDPSSSIPILLSTIEKLHCKITKVPSYKESIRNIREEYPDIIIINIKSPIEEEGIKTIHATKKELNNKFIFIIIVIDKLGQKIVPILPYFDDYIEKKTFTKEITEYKLKRALRIISDFDKINLLYKDNKELLKEKEKIITVLKEEQKDLAGQVKIRTKEIKHTNETLLKKNEIIENDMKITSKLQKNLLPQKIPLVKSYSIHNFYLPMNQIGGDFYDFIEMRENKIGILIGDVSGHGIASAFITFMVKASLSSHRDLLSNPSLLLANLNKQLIGKMYYNFITAAYAVFNLDANSLSFASAGHLPIFLYKHNINKVITLGATGTIIGIMKDASFAKASYKIDKGDRILFFTDGLIEVFNKKRELYGIDRLKDTFANTKNIPKDKIIDYIISSIKNFSHNKSFKDDITVILMEAR